MKNFVKNSIGVILVFLFMQRIEAQTLKTTVNTNIADSQIITALKLRTTLNTIADSVTSKASVVDMNLKASAISVNQKLHTASTKTALIAFADADLANFDGSQWVATTGDRQDNGVDNFGTVIRVSATKYWKRSGPVIVDFSTNLFIGDFAGASNTPTAVNVGRQNTFIGYNSGKASTTGYAKTFTGYNSGINETTATGNTYFGYQTGYNNTIGSFNTAVGTDAGYMNAADRNSFFGWHSGFGSITGIITGSDNHFLGYETAQKLTSGYSNNAHGSRSLYFLTTGFNNSAFGQNTGFNITTGSNNTLMGFEAGQAQTTAVENTYVGQRSGFYSTTGGSNSGLGIYSLFGTTTGTTNTGVGGSSGELNTTGSGNTFVGFNAGNVAGQKVDGFFSTAIGYGTIFTKNYQMVLGSADIGETLLRGATLINTTTNVPTAQVNIESTTKGLLIPRLTQVQRNAITTPAQWLQIICTDCTATDASVGVLQIYNGTVWKNAY